MNAIISLPVVKASPYGFEPALAALGDARIIMRSPDHCSKAMLGDFMALIHAGREIAVTGLEGRVKAAVFLFFLVENGVQGVAAIKRALPSYRKYVAAKSGVALDDTLYPYELGWVFVMPSARQHDFVRALVTEAARVADGAGMFANPHADNNPVCSALESSGFVRRGVSYMGRGHRSFQAFTKAGDDLVEEQAVIRQRPPATINTLVLSANSAGLAAR